VSVDHDRQWFNTLIPPSHESAAVTVDCISRLSETVRLTLRYTTVDIHCRDGSTSETVVKCTGQAPMDRAVQWPELQHGLGAECNRYGYTRPKWTNGWIQMSLI